MLGKLRRSVAVLAGAVIVVGVAGCAGTGNDPTSVADGGFQSGDFSHFYAPGHRATVHAVSGETLQGTPINLASYRGNVVVVNFWSSTCAPCSAEARYFESLSKTDASKGVRFVGIDERDNRDAGLAFERGHNVTYPSIFDPTDAYVLAFPGAVPSTTPFTIVLDRHGGIAASASDSLDYTHLETLVHQVLTESA